MFFVILMDILAELSFQILIKEIEYWIKACIETLFYYDV